MYGLSFIQGLAEQRLYNVLKKSAVPWNENFKFNDFIVFKASTWNPPHLFEGETQYGRWGFRLNTLSEGQPLDIFKGNRKGKVFFDGDVEIPVLYEIMAQRRGKLWMSITPMEILTLRPGIRWATDKVVIGGLGMGWVLDKVCAKKSVKEVIVVEQSEELLDWYGRDLCKKYPKVSDVICGDVFEQIGRHGDAKYLLDIWESYGTANYDERVLKAKADGHKIWAWGDVPAPKRENWSLYW
jgi:hypothetical protein